MLSLIGNPTQDAYWVTLIFRWYMYLVFRKGIAFILLGLLFTNCRQSIDNSNESPMKDHLLLPPTFKACLDHHGFEDWLDVEGLEFSIQSKNGLEHHMIDLRSRNTCIMGDSFSIVKNEAGYFVSPSLASFDGDPKFYHNVYFYFVAMPFVLTDPGINYETIGDFILNDTTYHGLKIYYDNGIGDADQDEYMVLIEKKTSEMRYLLYTVTYYSKEKSKQWYAKRYDTYERINGVLLPSQISSYQYRAHELGPLKNTKSIHNIDISFQPYPSHVFNGKEPSEEFIK